MLIENCSIKQRFTDFLIILCSSKLFKVNSVFLLFRLAVNLMPDGSIKVLRTSLTC